MPPKDTNCVFARDPEPTIQANVTGQPLLETSGKASLSVITCLSHEQDGFSTEWELIKLPTEDQYRKTDNLTIPMDWITLAEHPDIV